MAIILDYVTFKSNTFELIVTLSDEELCLVVRHFAMWLQGEEAYKTGVASLDVILAYLIENVTNTAAHRDKIRARRQAAAEVRWRGKNMQTHANACNAMQTSTNDMQTHAIINNEGLIINNNERLSSFSSTSAEVDETETEEKTDIAEKTETSQLGHARPDAGKVAAAKKMGEDIAKVVGAWNALGLSQVKEVRNARRQMLTARIRQDGVERVLEVVQRVGGSPYLMGVNDRGWRATIDWILRPNNYDKILTGNYERSGSNAEQCGGASEAAIEAARAEAERRIRQRGV